MKSLSWVAILLPLLIAGCGGNDSTENAGIPPRPTPGTGIIMGNLSMETALNKLNVTKEGSPIGVGGVTVKLEEDDSLTDITDSNGNFLINNVPGGTWTLLADFVGDNGERFAIRKPNISVNIDNVLNLGSLSLEKTGVIQGNVQLKGEADHIGIDVFIPGTSLLAKTDSQGNFAILYVLKGTYDLRVEKTGFVPNSSLNVSVISGQVVTVQPVILERIRTSFNVAGNISLSGKTGFGNVPIKLGLTSSGQDYETSTATDGSYNLAGILPGDYFLRAGDRTNNCTIGFPGTSDGEIATFISDTPSVSVNNTDVLVNPVALHSGSCATILGEDSSGSYVLPHQGFDFETRTFTGNPSAADLFVDIVYSKPVTDSSDCSSFTLSTIGENLSVIEANPQPDIFTAFRNLRTVPVSGFISSSNFDATNFQNILFIVRTTKGNHVKVVTNGWGFRNADGFIGCNLSLGWQLQPDGALSFDY